MTWHSWSCTIVNCSSEVPENTKYSLYYLAVFIPFIMRSIGLSRFKMIQRQMYNDQIYAYDLIVTGLLKRRTDPDKSKHFKNRWKIRPDGWNDHLRCYFQTGATATTCQYWTATRWRSPPSAAAPTSAPRTRPCSAASRSQFSILPTTSSNFVLLSCNSLISLLHQNRLKYYQKIIWVPLNSLSVWWQKRWAMLARNFWLQCPRNCCATGKSVKNPLSDEWLVAKTVRDIKFQCQGVNPCPVTIITKADLQNIILSTIS